MASGRTADSRNQHSGWPLTDAQVRPIMLSHRALRKLTGSQYTHDLLPPLALRAATNPRRLAHPSKIRASTPPNRRPFETAN